ncbi:MAG: hypothetical protein HYT87_16830 [Nitrospirae bacterium]|nr:hypothetical protein [Nitrospirota bacterium]
MGKKEQKKEKVIPFGFIPNREGRFQKIGGKEYLVMNDAMFTFYERSIGEFSPFFVAMRDEKTILACKCTKCGIVRCPPFVTHCTDCNFAPTESVEVEQTGVMLSTPPVTYFANSLFLDKAPFGRGRVVLKGADTALSVMLYTTTGILTPGLIRKGTEVKIIFKDHRIGEISDIFAVPLSELSPKLASKKGVVESELNWASPVEPKYGKASKEEAAAFKKSYKELESLAKELNKSKRARKAIEGWKRNVAVKTKSGQCAMIINNGDFKVKEGKTPKVDFVLACEDLKVLLDGLNYKGAITDSVVTKKLWISKNIEFNTIFKLDRMARSLARERKERGA